MVKYDVKMVIVIRRDLNMRKGKMCAQAGHASLMFVRDYLLKGRKIDEDSIVGQWLFRSQAKIVVGCDDEKQLNDLVQKARNQGLMVHVVTDAGNTEFHGEPTVTCAALGPARKDQLDKITGDLKLL